MHTNRIWLPFLLLMSLVACDLPHQPGPMPSEIVETVFEPGLNILGIIRADGEAGSSFININRALTTEEIYSDTIQNFSPRVDHVRVSARSSQAEYLFSRDGDSSDWSNYLDSTLMAVPGETYDLEISAPGFPLLTGSTQVPLQPQVAPGTLQRDGDQLSLVIQHDPSIFEYKLYLLLMDGIQERIIQPTNENTISVDWQFDPEAGPLIALMLAGLDENLTRYGNSPISFIPNTYHPDGSTVSGGYGCFGSVAISWVDLSFLN